MTKNIMIVGVGGQGSLLASKLLGHVLLSQNYDVKVSEVHGMSQRGGSVVTYVRYGDKVYSPIIDKGQADVIISFEKLEAARYMNYLKKGGKIVVSDQEIDPMPVITGAAEYPENLIEKMKAAGADIDDMDALSLGGRQSKSGKYRAYGTSITLLPGDQRGSLAGVFGSVCTAEVLGDEQESVYAGTQLE